MQYEIQQHSHVGIIIQNQDFFLICVHHNPPKNKSRKLLPHKLIQAFQGIFHSEKLILIYAI